MHPTLRERDEYTGGIVVGLMKYPKYIKLLNCEIISEPFHIKLKYATDYVIDALDTEITYKEEKITLNQEKIEILLKDLKNTFKEARAKLQSK